MVCKNTKHAFSTIIHLYICKFDMIHVILIWNCNPKHSIFIRMYSKNHFDTSVVKIGCKIKVRLLTFANGL